MPLHPALQPGRAAVITGAASGVGLAAAEAFVRLGMKVVLADANAAALESAEAHIATAAGDRRRVRSCFSTLVVRRTSSGYGTWPTGTSARSPS